MKKPIQVITALLITLTVYSQTFTPPSYATIDTNYRTYVNQLFGQLEANRVNTGLLVDYALDFTEPKIYNGTVLHDSTCIEPGIFSELYKTIFSGKFNTNTGALRHPTIHDSLWHIARQREVITLSGLLFKYNAIKPDANTTGKMQVVNGQLKDVYTNGVWQNPYDEFRTIAISPSIITYNLTYCSVILPSNLWLGNMNSEIVSIQFDAGDGVGYRNLQFDVPLFLNYADTGWKHWIFKLTLTNSQQLYFHSKVYFNNTSNLAGSGGITSLGGTINNKATVTATESYLGVYGKADIIISYRNSNDPVIRKPLIVAEGFDPGHITKPEEPEGSATFERFVYKIDNSGSNNLRNLLLSDPTIANDPSEYDIIYINWRNGTDYLQRNELVLEEVIRWVNQRKQSLNGVRQPNVVIGNSMGGVIARMALGRMDRAGGYLAHETRLYVSIDAPHQGANMPLGYQAAARNAAASYIALGPVIVGPIEYVMMLLNKSSPLEMGFLADQPAAKQLLIKRIDFFYNQANGVHQAFMNELRTQWAYPVNIRSVAISNGSECAIDQEFPPGANLIYHYRSTKTRFIGDIILMAAGAGVAALTQSPFPAIPFSIPGTSKFELTLDIKALANGGGNRVYYGNVKITKKVAWLVPVSINLINKSYFAPVGLLPFDSYPGSLYEVAMKDQPGLASQDWMFTYDNTFIIQRRFAFIHTTSALDIGGGNTPITNTEYNARYIGAAPPVAPFTTPFQNFTTAYNSPPITIIGFKNPYQFISNGSEPHVGFYKRSSDWLAKELDAIIPNTTNCSFMCSNNNSTITGAATLCGTPQVYTLTNPPAGATITWSSSPIGIVAIAPPASGTQVTVTKLLSGNFTLKASITGSGCGTLDINSPSYRAGGYSSSDYPITGTSSACKNVQIFYSTLDLPGATNYQWTWPAALNLTYQNGQGTRNLTLKTNTTTGQGTITVRVANACDAGGSPAIKSLVVNNCGSFFMASPNPSSGNVNITAIQPPGLTASVATTKIYQLKVVDQYGVVKKQYNYPAGVTTTAISLNDLVAGIYTLQAFDGTEWGNRQVVKQ